MISEVDLRWLVGRIRWGAEELRKDAANVPLEILDADSSVAQLVGWAEDFADGLLKEFLPAFTDPVALERVLQLRGKDE